MNTMKITFMNGKAYEVRGGGKYEVIVSPKFMLFVFRNGKCLLFNMNNIMFIDAN